MSTSQVETEIETLEAKIDKLIIGLAQLKTEVERLTRPAARRIMPASQAWEPLGYSNYSSLWRKIGDDRLYRPGVEVFDRRSVGASAPSWYVDVDAAIERDRELSAKRG